MSDHTEEVEVKAHTHKRPCKSCRERMECDRMRGASQAPPTRGKPSAPRERPAVPRARRHERQDHWMVARLRHKKELVEERLLEADAATSRDSGAL